MDRFISILKDYDLKCVQTDTLRDVAVIQFKDIANCIEYVNNYYHGLIINFVSVEDDTLYCGRIVIDDFIDTHAYRIAFFRYTENYDSENDYIKEIGFDNLSDIYNLFEMYVSKCGKRLKINEEILDNL